MTIPLLERFGSDCIARDLAKKRNARKMFIDSVLPFSFSWYSVYASRWAMHQIVIETANIIDAKDLVARLNRIEEIDVIEGRNFSGELSAIEVYLPLVASVIVAITPMITAFINKNKASSIKIDGEKIELTNVSSDLAEKVLEEYLKKHQTNDEKQK